MGYESVLDIIGTSEEKVGSVLFPNIPDIVPSPGHPLLSLLCCCIPSWDVVSSNFDRRLILSAIRVDLGVDSSYSGRVPNANGKERGYSKNIRRFRNDLRKR